MFSQFFIERPRFAMVISCFLVIAGGVCALRLPIEQYPNVAPPVISVTCNYAGADAETTAKSVAIPIEEQVNGVEGMIYMRSTSANDGTYSLNVTFEPGTDYDMALVKVQNKVNQAEASLPPEVTNAGITIQAAYSDTLAFIALTSPNGTKDALYLADYATNEVKKSLQRIHGMGTVSIFGSSKYAMRIWLDPERLSSLGLSASDISNAIQAQNKQAALGSIGAVPTDGKSDATMKYSVIGQGRLSEIREFENIIIKDSGGTLVKLRDVARVELGAQSYNTSAIYNDKPSVMIMMTQGANGNAIDIMRDVRALLEDLKETLPDPDMEFSIVYEGTDFIMASMREIVETLVLTFLLVVLVCYIFLQDWRVTLVPTLAIPISLMATFVGLSSLGYTLNILTLFGLVLVIGTVVDDSICVVERVLFVMENGKPDPVEATKQAMKDVGSSLIATTLIFLAIFVPVAFLGGITGTIYKQFGVTMSFAVCCSTLVATTLSPAICALILKDVKPKTRGPFAWFNKALALSTSGFIKVSMLLARSFTVIILCLGAMCFALWIFMSSTPTEFIPEEDKGVVLMDIQLPDGATMSRTEDFIAKIRPGLIKLDGLRGYMSVSGQSLTAGSGENLGMFVLPLKDWSEREDPDLHQASILAKADAICSQFTEASVLAFGQPAIPGLGTTSGIELQLLSRKDSDPQKLYEVLKTFIAKLNNAPEIAVAFSSYTSTTPHIFAEIDRDKAYAMSVSTGDVMSLMQSYFGSYYINDINLGAQVNQVIMQSEWKFRDRPETLNKIHVPNSKGSQVPLGSFVTFDSVLHPSTIERFNLYSSAQITVALNPGYSSGQGIQRIEEIARELPDGYGYGWSGQTYQEQGTQGQFTWIIIAGIVFGFLFLVAQYESLGTPVAVMLSLPVAVLGAMLGIKFMGITMSTYTELGMLLLVGLATKNAILIVEFAKEQREVHGLSIMEAAAEGGRERFRSVLMTAFTTVLGVLPMLFATGAGAASRIHVGTTMFFGMSISTVLGIFLVPGLFVMMQTTREKAKAWLASFNSNDDEEEEDNDENEK